VREQELWGLILQWGEERSWPEDPALVNALRTGSFDYGARDAFRWVTVDRLNWPAPEKSSNRNDSGYKAIDRFILALERTKGVDALVVEHDAQAELAKEAGKTTTSLPLSAAKAKKGR
jgi:hypothetical protein